MMRVNLGETERLKYLIDTGAKISIVSGTRLRPEINYEPTKDLSVKGISDALLRTDGTVLLKYFTTTQETTHLFQVMGDSLDCRYDGILGQNFWKDKRATIDYCNVITMGEIVMDFDDEPEETTDVNHISNPKTPDPKALCVCLLSQRNLNYFEV
jgi:hypothetical protein